MKSQQTYLVAAVRVGIISMVLWTGTSLAGAVTIPGDPTPNECSVIAQQAVDRGVSFAAELEAQGGGTCPVVAPTTAPTVLAATALPTSATVKASGVVTSLPKSGTNATGTLVAGGVLVLLGGALLVINRRRSTEG